MALRIRENDDIVCAAKTNAEEGDTYIDDNLHYYLSVLTNAIRPSKTHDTDNLWFWNISPEVIAHYADIHFNEEVVQPRRKDKKYISIQELVLKNQH